MVTHGKLVIFRMTDTTDTEDAITTDKVEFDGDAQVPDEKSKVVSFSPRVSRTDTGNPAPFQETARKPDSGFAATRYTLRVYFDESSGSPALGIAKIRDWLAEENAVKGKFREGRFGIRNDYRPEYDVTPDNTGGYKIVDFQLDQELLHHSVVLGTIILEYSGTAARIGA